MVGDQNYLKVKKVLLFFLTYFFSQVSFANDIKISKIADLEDPWGSTFINNKEIIITEKIGKIKLNNIFQASPDIDSGYHYGSRLAIKGNQIYASIGERGAGMIAQDPTNHTGSIIRINLDGTIPKDNPKFQGQDSWLPEIYQIGVRNPQGLTYSKFDDKIYASNHGARGGDWFGEIKKGETYGWKILGWGGTNYSGIPIGPKWEPGFTKAIQYWVPSIAASAITIYDGKEFKQWNGKALITSLKDQSLRILNFEDLDNVKEEI